MEQPAAEYSPRESARAALERVRQHFEQRTPIFWQLWRLRHYRGSITDLPGTRDDGGIDAEQLKQLDRHICAEHDIPIRRLI